MRYRILLLLVFGLGVSLALLLVSLGYIQVANNVATIAQTTPQSNSTIKPSILSPTLTATPEVAVAALSVFAVRENAERYVNTRIRVRGYFLSNDAMGYGYDSEKFLGFFGAITNTTNTNNPYTLRFAALPVRASKKVLREVILVSGVEYVFEGLLLRDDNLFGVLLDADKITPM